MRFLFVFAAGLWVAVCGCASASAATPHEALFESLVHDPSPADWSALARFDGTLTRRDFEARLDDLFDPAHGLSPYLRFEGNSVLVYASQAKEGGPVLVLHFAAPGALASPRPVTFRAPGDFRRSHAVDALPLAGLRVAIDPADIGGRWAKLEDRSVRFPGYGTICEGDLNVVVGRLLRDRLRELGATVFLVRDRTEPVLSAASDPRLLDDAARFLLLHPALLAELSKTPDVYFPSEDSRRLQFAAGLFVTKTLETLARADLIRRSFTPDLTIVLQHDATPESARGRLVAVNRNILFVEGAYEAGELRLPEQRFRLLTKLLEDTSPIEIKVADAISGRFKAVTGYPPVLYGDSANTRLVLPRDPYVVARNLAFNRTHDGPVVVTEPYFMNQPETLARLLAGDYQGKRMVAGAARISIYREYADCVAQGILDAYGR